MSQDVSRTGDARGAEQVLVSLSDVPLIQIALSSYAAGLRRQARSRGMSGGDVRRAREETRKTAQRAAQLAAEIGRR